MPAQAAYTTQYSGVPYLTTNEFTYYPTALDTYNLLVSSSQTGENTALFELLLAASAWIDEICGQVLAATVDIETKRTRINNRGEIAIHPDYWPILEVRDLEYGVTPNQMIALSDLTSIFIEKQELTVYPGPSFFTGANGPLQFGPTIGYRSPIFLRYTYVNGYANTTLTAPANIGDSTLTVADTTGMYGGAATVQSNLSTPPATKLRIFDTPSSEAISVATVPSATSITLNGTIQFPHAVGTSVSAIPRAVKQACALLTAALVKTRGDRSLVMRGIDSPPDVENSGGGAKLNDYLVAEDLLRAYMRVF